ncbi:MAG: site-2 protease family protein [Chlorogloea purpurea SAG 13.99]|jgi:Zn-dependent protease|nr:site-2 protease family protein [Chlorogloea purpurea SAG 13.99]
MRSSWRIGSIREIPLYIDPSWLAILFFITALNAGEVQAQLVGDNNPPWLSSFMGFLMALLLFASVLLHELGHSLVALSQGIKVNSITLFLFGGMASIERESDTPLESLKIAVAGPAVSLVLFASLSLLGLAVENLPLWHYVLMDVAQINFILALFNVIPGMPLDGGQILKSVVWHVTGDRLKGLRWASRSGQIMGCIGISLGLFLVLLTGDLGGAWLSFIGWFIFKNASAYNRLSRLQEGLLSLTAASVMTKDFKILKADRSLEEFTREYIINPHKGAYYAVSGGRYRGLVRPSDLQSIERGQWAGKTLLDIVHPLDTIVSVPENAPLFQVIGVLDTITDKKLTVLSPAGAVAGVIDKADIVKTIAAKYDIVLQEGEIDRIKSGGQYPSYLPLSAVAKTLTKK